MKVTSLSEVMTLLASEATRGGGGCGSVLVLVVHVVVGVWSVLMPRSVSRGVSRGLMVLVGRSTSFLDVSVQLKRRFPCMFSLLYTNCRRSRKLLPDVALMSLDHVDMLVVASRAARSSFFWF